MSSEAGQDFWILERVKGRGFFVDVGAHDGRFLSNTWELEQAGWTGICIEPHPRLFEDLVKNRRVPCINRAIAEAPGMYDYSMCEPEGWSGLERTHNGMGARSVVSVNAAPLRWILADRPDPIRTIDYLSIDAEGGDFNVLRGIDWNAVTIRYISLEVDKLQSGEVETYLKERGYVRADRLGADEMYAREGEAT
jgi:FkbM family methyltransferase